MENKNDEEDRKIEKAFSEKTKKIDALTSLEIKNDSKVIADAFNKLGLGYEIHIRNEDGGQHEPICGYINDTNKHLTTLPYYKWLKLDAEVKCDKCETKWNETHK